MRRQSVFGGLHLPLLAFIAIFWGLPSIRAEQQSQRIELHVISTPKVGPLAPQQWLTVLLRVLFDAPIGDLPIGKLVLGNIERRPVERIPLVIRAVDP